MQGRMKNMPESEETCYSLPNKKLRNISLSNFYVFSLRLLVNVIFSTVTGHFQELSDEEEMEISFQKAK